MVKGNLLARKDLYVFGLEQCLSRNRKLLPSFGRPQCIWANAHALNLAVSDMQINGVRTFRRLIAVTDPFRGALRAVDSGVSPMVAVVKQDCRRDCVCFSQASIEAGSAPSEACIPVGEGLSRGTGWRGMLKSYGGLHAGHTWTQVAGFVHVEKMNFGEVAGSPKNI